MSTTFKFNFSGSKNEDKEKEPEIQWLKSEEIIPSDNDINNLDEMVNHAKMFTCGDIEIGHVLVNNLITYIREEDTENVIQLAEKEHSDLVAGKYEGGLKIWECTYDLIEYFEANPDIVDFKNLNVLDLGCGAGILGIYAFLKNASVTFQDYNKEILEYCTIPNVLLNIEEEGQRKEKIKKCQFFSGDWASFDEVLPKPDMFDVILTSETIYNQINYDKLISLFKNRLKSTGCIYVAAKTYYFGVGGGTREFETALKKCEQIKSEVVWKTTSGIQREILKINKL